MELDLTVSAHHTIKGEIHTLVEANLEHNVRLMELEYQP